MADRSGSQSMAILRLRQAQEKLLRAKRRGARFTNEAREIEKEEERLELKKRGLVTKRLMIHGQYNDWLNDTILHRTVVPYSKAWNTAFAAKVHSRLPREIRDMIYGYLWYFNPKRMSLRDMGSWCLWQHYAFESPSGLPDTVDQYSLVLETAQNLFRYCDLNITKMCDDSALPHYLSPDYVGPDMAYEVGQSFYHALNSVGLLQCGADSVRSVLTGDCFKLGLPTIDLIRTLTIHCKIDRYRTPPPGHARAITCQHTVSQTGQVRKEMLEKDFSALLDIKKKQGFKLRIILYQRSIRMEVIAEVIEALAGVVQKLQRHGACVTVLWTYRGHWESHSFPPSHMRLVDRDVTDFFNLPRALWEYDMRKTILTSRSLITPRHYLLRHEVDPRLGPRNIDTFNNIVHGMYADFNEEQGTTDGEDDLRDYDEEAGSETKNSSDDDDSTDDDGN